MRTNLVVANWKMHGHKKEVTQLLNALKNGINTSATKDSKMVICPPSLFLGQVQKELAETGIAIGTQNAHPQNEGAFTGEVGFAMLREFSCSYAIIGHSERREIFAETDKFIAEKFAAAQVQSVIPILCIGETQAQRESGLTESTVLGQLQAVISEVGIEAFANAVIAYEPIWAIGTGLTASPEQAQEVHAAIRSFLAKLDQNIAENISILYGGSVKANNAEALFYQSDIDGALVGGASLDAEEFLTIYAAA
ncbi:MAG: triose-phosphate isomerase [SAR86 cluster bacterium]|uniref:Triosephosphate isomerase n=1 Tax=SAR86 cluster bacterium TaxID=2030880 RepID=A0A2A5CG37_9GAMM|nr:MAG: triose-phosphate isomerase [SAR86 cluster bacterium]